MSKNVTKLPKKHQNEQTNDTYIELCRWNIKEGAKLGIPMSKA